MNSPGDALSDVLRMVHLKACIYFVKDMPSSWGMDIPATVNGPLHMVLQGQCVMRLGEQNITLQAGDAALLPHGARHQMLDNHGTVPEPGPQMMQRLMTEEPAEPAPNSTRMLCGHFEWDGEFDHPLFKELPELIVIRSVFDNQDAVRFSTIVDLITTECMDNDPGSAAIADRMGEVLFVSMLRSWMVENKPGKGVLATISDPGLSRALRYIHEHPERDLGLKELARVAGMSRTTFAVRFRMVMGTPPAAYLAEWRMLKARRLLLQTELSMPAIVSRIGYGSDAAFTRAFKRRFGNTPGRLRRSHSAGTGVETA